MSSSQIVRAPQLKVVRGEILTSTVDVAEFFDMRPDNVMQAVENLIQDLNSMDESNLLRSQEIAPRFLLSEYADARNRKQPMYLMNEVGFSVLAGNFKGKRALKFRIAYAQEFIRMREALQRQQAPGWQTVRLEGKAARRAETDVIQIFIEYAKDQGSQHADKYYINITKMLVNALGLQGLKRDMMTAQQLVDLRDGEQVAADAFLEAMTVVMNYKDGFQFAKAAVVKYVAARTTSKERFQRLQERYGKQERKGLSA